MRELKFRAWDKEQKKMLYGVSIGTVKIWDENEPLISNEFSYSEDCIFEQYTGLKDKNGKEIYEGDILMTPDGKLIEIGWNNTYARFGYHGITEGYNAFTSLGKCRVIGNIHENPELLEEV